MSTLCISNAIIKLAMESKIKKSEENAKKDVEGVATLEATDATGDAKAVTGENIAEAVATNASAAVETDANAPPVKPPTKFGWNKGKKFNMTRVPRPVKCDESCQMKCTQHFSAELRAQICQTFWSMDYKRRKDFVLTKIETREVNSMTAKEYRKTDRAQRTFTNRYFLKGPRSLNVRVCAAFFMATLCISRRVINNAIENADQQTGFYAGEDRRGKRTPGNKIPEVMLNEIKRHIESYPTWVPHKGYKTRFLHSSLNIKRLWREYKEICEQQQRKFASANYFSNVFHNNYRLAFLKPTSKHAHKVSAVKKEPLMLADGAAAAPPKKINTNISDFTGEEGGFWIRPQVVVAGNEQRLYETATTTALQLTTQTHTTTQSMPLTTQLLQAPLRQSLAQPAAQQTVVIDGKHNVLHIQENLQLHAPQTSTSSQSSVYAAASYFPVVSYAPPQVPLAHQQQQQPPPPPQQQQQPQLTEPILHGIANVSAMHGYAPSNYEQQLPAVFRML